MVVRIISSIIALPLLFFFVIMGGLYLEIAAGIISCVALYEFFNALKKKHKPITWPSYLMLLAYYVFYHFDHINIISGIFVVYVATLLIIYVLDESIHIKDVGITLIGSVYIIFFFYHVVLLSQVKPSFMIWYIFIVSWGADTGAYFVGNLIGKRKLSPTVSPNKSVEGAIGGVLTAIIISVIVAIIFDASFLIYAVLIAVVGSVISVFGDLVASKIKREMDVKDYGNIMPGHGGVLDRFDSLLLVTPFVYYCVQLILWVK